MFGALGKSAIAAVALSLAIGPRGVPAVRPEAERERHLVSVPSRADKKRAKRRKAHADAIKNRDYYYRNRPGNKLSRRLKRNAILGRNGAY